MIMGTHTVMPHVPIQGDSSAHIESLRTALTVATEARRATEADMRNRVPGAYDAHRAADRAEMDACLALFDARHASDTAWLATPTPFAPVGVSLVKATDGTPAAPSTPGIESLPGRLSHGLDRNDLSALSDAFGRLSPKTLAPFGLDQGREFI
jgi:hypothetical protein